MNYRWLRDPVEKFIGRPMDHWRLSGGGALSEVWVQIMADVVGLPMHQMLIRAWSTPAGRLSWHSAAWDCCRWRISHPK